LVKREDVKNIIASNLEKDILKIEKSGKDFEIIIEK
jgi:hypothetical protein